MTKSATPRHSKNTRKPVVIDLDPMEVKRVNEPQHKPHTGDKLASETVPAAEPVGDFTENIAENISAKQPVFAEKPAEKKPEPQPSAVASAKTETAFKTAAHASISGNTMNSSAPVQKSTSSLSSGSVLSGFAGGVIALLVAGALQWAGILPSLQNNQTISVLSTQVSALEKELDALHNQPVVQPAPMPDAQLLERLSAAEQSADTLRSDFAKVQQQLSSLQTDGNGADTSQLTSQISTLMQRLTEMESRLSDASTQSKQTAEALSGDNDALKAMQSKFVDLQQRFETQVNQPDLAPIIAVNALKAAIDRGGSYSNELETFTALLPQDNPVAQPLQQMASTGVPTISQLNAQFASVADKIVATETQPAPDADFWDQLVASAKGLVRSRPVGDVAGSGAGPVSARVEFALQNGDAERALTEWQQFSPQAKAVGEAFYVSLLARRDADALLAKLIADTMQPKASRSDNSQSAPDKSATGAN